MVIKRSLTLLALVGLLLGIWKPTLAQQTGNLSFSETGHTIQGEFLTFYQSVPDPLLVYGFPITEEFTDPILNIKIQYFERARFELDENAPDGQRVKLSTLGSLIFSENQVQPVNMATDIPACRSYSTEKGTLAVCYAFLAFFDAHGGLEQFGLPISNYVKESDLYVQYFERARFEWHPELSPDRWVRLAEIGRIQFDQSQHDSNLLQPIKPGESGLFKVTRLQPRAFCSRAVVKADSRQALSVLVQNQNLGAVQDAVVQAYVVSPAGDTVRYSLPPTDQDGITKLEFDVGSYAANQVIQVQIKVTYNGLESNTTTWFRIWW